MKCERDVVRFGLAALLLPAALCGCNPASPSAAPAPAGPPKLDAAVVKRGDISRRITLPAEVAPWREVTVYARTAGRLTKWRTWPDGRSLDVGDVLESVEGDEGFLAELEAPEMDAEIARAVAEAAQAKAEVTKAEADRDAAIAAVEEPKRERVSADALVLKARSAVRAAEGDVEKWRLSLTLATDTHERYRKLVSEKTVTDLEYDRVRTQFKTAGAEAASAESRAAALRDEVKYAEARLGELDARVKSAEARRDAAVAAVEAVRSRVPVADAKVTLARDLASYRTVRAPFAGRITKRFVDLGALIQNAAASNTQASPLVTITDVSKLRLIVDVPESEVRHLSAQTAGTLALPEVPGLTLPVKASRTSGVVRNAARTQRVEMDLIEYDPRLRPGLYAQATLTMETHAGVLLVPPAAVGGKGADRFVFALVDGKAVKRGVEVAFADAKSVEVRPAGGAKLDAGDTVLMPPPTVSLRDGQAVEARVIDVKK